MFRPIVSPAVDLDSQRVSGATDARVVVADQVFAPARNGIIFQMEQARQVCREIALDLPLVLRSGWNDLRLRNQPIGADAIAVVDEPAWSFGSVAAFAFAQSYLRAGRSRLGSIFLRQVDRVLECRDEFQ